MPNKFNVVSSFQAAPGPVTTSIEADILKTADFLEKLKCPASLYVHMVTCGRKNSFTAYDRSFVLERMYVTQEGLANMSAKSPDNQDRSTQSFELSAESLLRVYEMVSNRVVTAETDALNAITSCDSDQCAGDCSTGGDAGDSLWAVGDTQVGSAGNTADMIHTADGGSNWTFGASDPFAAAIPIGSTACVAVDADSTRVFVARGATEANTSAVKYTDDGGLTWVTASGIATGKYVVGPKAIFALDYYNIWVAMDAGYIYYSNDGGGTFTAQASGTPSAQDLYAVRFANADDGYAVGKSNTILKTTDGGTTWSQLTGPTAQAAIDALSVQTHSKSRAWVGYNNGELYYTHDGGSTWNRRSHSLSGSGRIPAMAWYDEYVGIAIHNTAAPSGSFLYTINGGYTWQVIAAPANSGLNDVIMPSANLAWAVGEVNAGTAVIVKVSGG